MNYKTGAQATMSANSYYGAIARRVRRQYSLRGLRRRAFIRQGGLCFWCGEKMLEHNPQTENDPRCVSADHHPVPQHMGGRTEPGNIVAACRECNSGRHRELDMPSAADATWSSGDDLPASPFDLLARLLDEAEKT